MISHRFTPFLVLLLLFAGLFSAPRCSADISVVGPIVQISAATGGLSVHTANGDVAFRVLSYTWVTRDRVDCALGNLRIGDLVVAAIFQDAGGLSAISIEAQTQGRRRILKGNLIVIQAVSSLLVLDPPGSPAADLLSAAIDSATLYLRDGQPAALNDLQIGDYLTIVSVIQPDGAALATRIEAYSPRNTRTIVVTGTVKSVSGDHLIVRTWRDKIEETLIVDPKHGPRRDRKPVAIGDLRRGDQIIAFGQRRPTGEIDAFSISAFSYDTEFNGTITAVNASEGWVGVAPAGRTPSITLFVYPATVLQLNGQDADIGDIRIGDRVGVRCITHAGGPWSATSLDVTRTAQG